jgi:chromate transport protein ChrA
MAFGRTAVPAVIGLLGLTILDLGREAIAGSWPHLGIAGLVLILAAATRVNPVALLALGGAIGYLLPA